MKKRRTRRPSAALVVACLALIVALSGTAVAAQQLVSGDKLIKQRSLSANRLRNHTLTGKQINLSKLGTVPSAAHATAAGNAAHATTAGTATSAATASNATELGGSPPTAFQSRVSGACAASSGIQQVNATGTVTCGPVSFYSGRVVTALNAPPTTFLTIPGIAHVASLNCQAGGANAELQNDGKATDIWVGGDATYVGPNWLAANTTYGTTGGSTWHLGLGSGTGAKVITVTVSVEGTGSSCIFQGYAQVMTS
jgi:hypothetical protein